MYRLIILIMVLSITSGCASVRIYHNHGSLPKMRIHLKQGYGDIRVKAKRSEVKFIWKKKI